MCNKDKYYFCNQEDIEPKSVWTDRSLCIWCWKHSFPGRATYNYAFDLNSVKQGTNDE